MGLILKEETFNKFGYNTETLKPSSCKLVVWKCAECGNITDKKYRDAKRINLCLNCSNRINANTNLEIRSKKAKEWYKTNEHPLKGKPRPIYVKEAIGRSSLGRKMKEETKQYLSILFTGDGNPFYGKKHSPENLSKMSKIQLKIAKRGKDCNFYGRIYHGKGSWYINNDKKVWMRSSWEVKYAKYLDKNNIKWEFEPRIFDLLVNQKECSYRHDFYLPESNCYIEIKGWWRDDAKEKYEHFILQYPDINIKLYMEEELKNLGVL